ncbi:MAG: hypothetical protein E7813_11220 [Bradyrhizobium sp.]|nr:MAG: hypothetical protein E7813_11220 [Bradyrhizobium sp.]
MADGELVHRLGRAPRRPRRDRRASGAVRFHFLLCFSPPSAKRRGGVGGGGSRRKLTNCITTLQFLPPNERVQKAIERVRADVNELVRTPPKSLRALRGVEGRSALVYFSELRMI